jgi:hypothetical protein
MGVFKNIFNDNNTINEKSILGFASFLIMTIFAIADIVSAYLGKELLVNDFIFNSFLIITLGSFGIASIDKFINTKNNVPDVVEDDLDFSDESEEEPKYNNKVKDEVID